uniref:MATH domain-containing protein n=1 Tax=Arundo donax TaxID=35708 RepID=A0A0A9HCQ1_ARUDO
MGVSSSNLTDAACAVHMFKINGYSATRATSRTDSLPSKPLAVGGYQWQGHYTPSLVADGNYWIAFKLVLLAVPRRADVKTALRCRPVYPPSNSNRQQYGTRLRDASGNIDEAQISHAFKRAEESSGWVSLCKRNVLEKSGIIMEDSFTVECTITVITELPDTATANVLPPYSGL